MNVDQSGNSIKGAFLAGVGFTSEGSGSLCAPEPVGLTKVVWYSLIANITNSTISNGYDFWVNITVNETEKVNPLKNSAEWVGYSSA